MDIEPDILIPSRLSTVGDVRRALHPLQAQADRVGRQVEEFAETLDRLSSLRNEQYRDCSKVLPLVQRYEQIAEDTVKRLKRRHTEDKRQLLRENRRRKLGHGSTAVALALYDDEERHEIPTSSTVRDLLHWEQERQTWELLGLMLQVHYPPHEDVYASDYVPLQRPRNLQIHKYSPEYAVYENYIATDDAAWEKHVILEWLNRSADESREDVEDLVEDMNDTSEQAQKSIVNGWLHSRERIKGEKRLRAWIYSISPSQLDQTHSIVGSNSKQAMVTQLDPDAVTRQGRGLDDGDLASERAIWFGCWELLRRGKSWDDVQEWCEQRQEGWRAVSMRGDPRLGKSQETASGSLAGRSYWRQLCLRLARSGGIDDYERAVYGLLGGDATSVFQVCRTWDDQLHGLLSCQLAQGFSFFFDKHFSLQPTTSSPETSSLVEKSLKGFIDGLFKKQETSEEALTPFRSLQSAIIKNLPAPFLRNQGLDVLPQLQRTEYALLNLKASAQSDEKKEGVTSPISLDDYDLIRVLTHVLLIYQYMNPGLAGSPAMENLIVAYVDFLGKAGKQQLLPLYASFLSEDRAATCLARQLPFIKDTTERQVVVRLIKQYGMEDEVILLAQLDSIVATSPVDPAYAHNYPTLELLDKADTGLKEVRPLRRDLIHDEFQPWQEDLIDCLEWFLLLQGDAKFMIYSAGIAAYQHFLRTKSYTAMRRLAQTIPTSRIAQVVKLPGQVNGEVHTADADTMDTDQGIESQNSRDTRLAEVKIFQDLESLAVTLDALDNWEQVVHAGTGARVQAHEGDKTALKVWKKELQAAHNIVVESVQPLLQGWLLPTKGETEQELQDLHALRTPILPSIILAYLSVLSFAGTWLQRENMLQCLNLAKQIADDDRDLCRCFVDAGRMAELMATIANISRQILAAAESTGGIKMKKKRRGGGELLDIWSVDAEREG